MVFEPYVDQLAQAELLLNAAHCPPPRGFQCEPESTIPLRAAERLSENPGTLSDLDRIAQPERHFCDAGICAGSTEQAPSLPRKSNAWGKPARIEVHELGNQPKKLEEEVRKVCRTLRGRYTPGHGSHPTFRRIQLPLQQPQIRRENAGVHI